MKTDAEVQLMLRERNKGKTLEQAAARAGMSVPTARKYLRSAKLPSTLRQARDYRTRPNPFSADWPWIEQHLARDPVRPTAGAAPPRACERRRSYAQRRPTPLASSG